MALGRSAAVVLGRFPLGESDLIVTFLTRDHGKVRGVARRARRMRSRFGGALELFTQGDLLFFESDHSDLVQIDHFDIGRPFARLRDDLQRLGQSAWMAECATRLMADRDPNPAVYGLILRAFTSVERGVPPARVALVFVVRCIDALGHRLRLEACVACGRRLGTSADPVALDLEGGGLVCGRCGRAIPGVLGITPSTVRAFKRLRASAWLEAVAQAMGPDEAALGSILEAHFARLAGQPPRTARFLREVTRL